MTLEAKAVGLSFAAEVTGVDFSRPLDSSTVAEIVAAMDRYAVCVRHHEHRRHARSIRQPTARSARGGSESPHA
jgi:hypothetical protein